MTKTIKSNVRKLLYCMITKFKVKQAEREVVCKQKQAYLHTVSDFLVQNMEHVPGVSEITQTVEKLKDYTKPELLCLVNKHKPDPVYEADELLSQNGHEVIRLPPYHCELNPIELIWSLAKRKVAKKNINLSAADTEKLITECFTSITADDWKKMTDHVVHVENKYKERDRITDNEMERIMINVGESDTSDSEESLQADFLDTDFDYDS